MQTNFRSKGPAYPLLHIDAFNSALAETPYADLDPVLNVAAHHGPSACCHMECGGLKILCPISGDGAFHDQLFTSEVGLSRIL